MAEKYQDREVVGLDREGRVVQWNAAEGKPYSSGVALADWGIHNLREQEIDRVGVSRGQWAAAAAQQGKVVGNSAMSKGEFLALQKELEGEERAIAMGQESDETDGRIREIEAAMAASQWMFHPDDGCVLKSRKLVGNSAMSKGEFLALQKELEGEERAIAMGQESDETDGRIREIEAAMAASQWMFHPDDGCVLKSRKLQQVVELTEVEDRILRRLHANPEAVVHSKMGFELDNGDFLCGSREMAALAIKGVVESTRLPDGQQQYWLSRQGLDYVETQVALDRKLQGNGIVHGSKLDTEISFALGELNRDQLERTALEFGDVEFDELTSDDELRSRVIEAARERGGIIIFDNDGHPQRFGTASMSDADETRALVENAFYAGVTVGSQVYWVDPDNGFSSGNYTVHEIYAESGSIEADDTMLMLKNEAGSECEVFAHELRPMAPAVLNDAQLAVLQQYEGGEFSHLCEVKSDEELNQALEDCGDGLLRFLMVELASSEDCATLQEAQRRIEAAVRQMQSVSDALYAVEHNAGRSPSPM